MSFAVSKDVVLKELETSAHILQTWQETLNAGIPGADFPATSDAIEILIRQLSSELLVVAGKCQSLALILAER